MVTVKGREAVQAFIANFPAEVEAKLLPGAARAGGKVIADEAKANAPSQEVEAAIRVRTARETDRVTATVTISGQWPRSLAIWAEYGTDPHYITVDDSQRGGRSARKINDLAKGGVLVIGGQPVGKTVFHPGARKAPFMRPALDMKATAAIAAAQAYVNARVTRGGIVGNDDSGDDDA